MGIEGMVELPDGSGCFVGLLPLPKDHWLYAPSCQEWDAERNTSADTPVPILGAEHWPYVIAAMQYAIRGATWNGTVVDFDPDAFAQNGAYALCGPCGGSASIIDGEVA